MKFFNAAFLALATSVQAFSPAHIFGVRNVAAPFVDGLLALQATNNVDTDATKTTSRRGFLTQALVGAATTATAAPLVAWAEESKEELIAQEEKLVEEIKQEEKDLIAELERDEKDEIKTEKDIEKIIEKIETQEESKTEPTKAEQKETEKMIVQLKKDEEKVEKETVALIQKIEKIEADVDKAEQLEKATEPDTPAATKAAVAEATSATADATDFVARLKERSEANDEFIADLKSQIKKTNREGFLARLKTRALANEDFATKYKEFLTRMKASF
jgi:outer membrane biosynthesis protein TonB